MVILYGLFTLAKGVMIVKPEMIERKMEKMFQKTNKRYKVWTGIRFNRENSIEAG